MKSWKGYNIIDLILVTVGVTTVLISGIIFNSKWYMIVSTLLGLFYVFTQAKGKIATQFLGVIYFCFYIYIAYSQSYYGEALVYLIVMLPMYFYGIIHWLANRYKKDNVVIIRDNLSKKEWLFLGVVSLVLSVGIYFLLKALNTKHIIVNLLSFITIIPAVYLLMRRCRWNHVAFLINDFIVPLLWVFLVIEGDWSFLPLCIYHIFQITYDIYGLVEWARLEKNQKIEFEKEKDLS